MRCSRSRVMGSENVGERKIVELAIGSWQLAIERPLQLGEAVAETRASLFEGRALDHRLRADHPGVEPRRVDEPLHGRSARRP